MKFAVHYELQLPTPWQDGDENRIFREALDHVVLAEQLGFEHMWAVEHHFTDDHSLSSSPATWLAAAAARTTRIRIGHGIACTPPKFVHPAKLAEHIATLDQISNGRVEFGTGESASRMELEGFGVDPKTKREAWLEAVREICNMMAMTPYPGYDGKFFGMPCRNLVPKPFQKPHPPLWVAGKPELAAQHGLGCLGFNAMSGAQAQKAVEQYYAKLETDCVPLGHSVNPNIAILAPMHVHRDPAEARRRAEHLKFFGFSVGEYYLKGEVRPGRQRSWETFEKIRDQIPALGADNPTGAVGSVDEVREHMRILEAAGVDQVLLLHQGGKLPHEQNCESLELFARQIMPEFRERDAEQQRRKRQRVEPSIEKAMARREWPRPMGDDEIPIVRPYGSASFIPTADAEEPVRGVSAETKGALGLGT
jgi:alkanesulfonate monooxygenase SsuD/methylene tetrahydromethanopterin reductase-like flavin-dependent oxidoreductase (luciferase family)